VDNYSVIVPDALLAWGKLPEVAIHFPRPWADHVEALCAKGELNVRDTKMLMARLEALCAEAVRAGRADLLSGLDTRTAELLGLSYSITTDDGRVIEIGRGKRYTWAEMRSVLATDDPKDAMRAVDQAKDLLAEVFPGARVGDVSDSADDLTACGSCGTTTSQVMIATVHDTHYCGRCWSLLTNESPVNFKRKTKTAKRRGAQDPNELLLTGSGEGSR
jgi:hypothetical protein